MFQLTGNFILIASTILAIALPILAAVLWSRKPPASGGRPVAVLKFLGRIGLILVAQVTAMAALFFYVNDQYGFYASWSDLLGLGHDTPARIVQVNELHPGTGKLEVLNVHAKSGVSADTLVWLPPGYDASGSTRYPVIMFLPGQPSHPQNLFNEYDFGDVASQAIAAGTVRPFVGVFPPIMIAPPRDTECVDVPNGPQAQTWLTSDVPAAVQAKYRVEPPGKHWSLMGWSTGALCAAKLTLGHPTEFSAAVSLAGEFDTYLDNTTGDLFGSNTQLRNENSATWLYHQYGMRGTKLLMISSKQDEWAWIATEKMAQVTRGDPAVSLITFPAGGHNFHVYKPYISTALDWLDRAGSLG